MPDNKSKIKKVVKVKGSPKEPELKKKAQPGWKMPKVLYQILSNKLPAGNTKPIKVPMGQNKICVQNPNNGQGSVVFTLGCVTYSIAYTFGSPESSGIFIFPGPGDGPYNFTNLPGPSAVDVFLVVYTCEF